MLSLGLIIQSLLGGAGFPQHFEQYPIVHGMYTVTTVDQCREFHTNSCGPVKQLNSCRFSSVTV